MAKKTIDLKHLLEKITYTDQFPQGVSLLMDDQRFVGVSTDHKEKDRSSAAERS